MKKTEKKAMKISEIVFELEVAMREFGDIEVFIINDAEQTFDSFGKFVNCKIVSTEENVLLVMHGEVALRP